MNQTMPMKILIIDDDQALCRSLQVSLNIKGHEVRMVFSGEDGIAEAVAFQPDIVFLDINLPGINGLETLPKLANLPGKPTVVIMTGESDNLIAVQAMRQGAFDYLRKPLELDEIHAILPRIEIHRNQETSPPPYASPSILPRNQPNLIGTHPEIINIHKKIGLLSRSKVTVLIQGKSGTGKELVARVLHEASAPDKPFVDINCSAVVSTLLESEFFGHEKGAFTGADRLKIGKLEYAGEGTVFFDEIGDMPIDLQGKLLRVLQEGEFVRVGGLEPIPFRARFMSATHRDLEKLVAEGEFRKDLFYRIAVTSLYLPPLRERADDIPQLVNALLKKITTLLGCPSPRIQDEALQKLKEYAWPGNVRELENVLTRSVALATDSVLTASDICLNQPHHAATPTQNRPTTLAEAEKVHVETTLNRLHWNITQTAKQLEISPTTLRKKIADYSLLNPCQ
jgi:two-component system response regulator AtoC